MTSATTVIALALALAGCAGSKQVYGPSGERGHALNCSGPLLTWNDCLSKASDLCGARGYAVLERNGEPTSSGIGTPQGVYASQSTTRTMLVSCR